MDHGVVVVDANLRLLTCNTNWRRMFQMAEDKVKQGTPWPDVMRQRVEQDSAVMGWSAEQKAALLDDLVHRAERGLVSRFAYEIRRPDGRILDVHSTPLPNCGGFVRTFTDITESRTTEDHLLRMQERYALALRSTNEGLYDWDIQSNALYYSDRLKELFALPEGANKPEDWVNRIHADDLSLYRQTHRAHLKGQTERFTCEYRMVIGAGRIVWVRQHGVAQRDRTGRAVRLTGSVGDVTAYKMASAALRASEERHALAMEAIDEGVYEWTLADDTVQLTGRLRELINFGSDTIPAKDWLTRIHPADLPVFTSRQRALLRGDSERMVVEFRISTVEGTYIWVRQHGIAQRDGNGRVTRVIGSAGDITDRKKAEYALHASRVELAHERELLKTTLETMDQGIFMADPSLRMVSFNHRFQEMFGLPGHLLDGQPSLVNILRHIHGAESPSTSFEDMRERFLGDKVCRTINTDEIRRPDGRVLEARNVPMRDGSFVRTFTDVTRHKHLEADLQAAKDSAEQALRDLQSTQQSLIESEKMASLGALVAGVAHEINTPVGITLTTASHLEEKARAMRRLFDEGKLRKNDFADFMTTAENACALLISNSNRAANLIQSFKQVAVDQTSEERRRFDLRLYIDEVLMSLGPKLKRTHHIIDVDCPDCLEIDSYPGPLAQVLTNLIMNSMIHGLEGRDDGRMAIGITGPAADGFVTLTYTDNGKGIPPHHLKRIFEPFFTTRRGQGGSGLGLNIVYNIVTQTLKGSLKAESELGKGAVFTLRFPAIVDRKDGGAALVPPPPPGEEDEDTKTSSHKTDPQPVSA